MRARSIKPGLFKNEILGTADPLYTIIFEGLWCLADRAGRLEDRPLRIHAEVAPYRHSESTVLALTWLHERGFIIRYDVGGQKFIQVVNFAEHQQPHIREAQSKIPPVQNQGDVEAPTKAVPSTNQGSAEHSPRSPSSLTPHSLTPDSPFPCQEGADAPGSARVAREPPPELHASCPSDAWAEWIAHRRRKRWPNDATTLRKQLAVLAPFDTETQRRMLDQSIQAGWQGVFELKRANSAGTPRATRYEQSRQKLMAASGMTEEELDAPI